MPSLPDDAGGDAVDEPEPVDLAEVVERCWRNVADDGPGVPESDRDRVFETGYSTTAGGTGLGLDIVRRIADAHGWEVRVTEGRAGGARFEITGVETASSDGTGDGVGAA